MVIQTVCSCCKTCKTSVEYSPTIPGGQADRLTGSTGSRAGIEVLETLLTFESQNIYAARLMAD